MNMLTKIFHNLHKIQVHWTYADLLKYYSSCKCISGGIGIGKSKAHCKQLDGNCADKNIVNSNIQMLMI